MDYSQNAARIRIPTQPAIAIALGGIFMRVSVRAARFMDLKWLKSDCKAEYHDPIEDPTLQDSPLVRDRRQTTRIDVPFVCLSCSGGGFASGPG